jgi:hypothetical protein
MAGTIRQQKFLDLSATATTIALAFDSAVLAGSTILAYVTNLDDGSGFSPTVTVADNINGAWPAATEAPARDTTNTQRTRMFVKPNAAAGSTTVTATYSATISFRGICIVEVTGEVAASLDQHTSQTQLTPTTGANATTSGTTGTLGGQPNTVVAFTFNNGGSGVPAVGTGYAAPAGASTGWAFGGGTDLARLESKNTSATTAVAGTFTAAGNTGHTTFVVVLLDATTTQNPGPPKRLIASEDEPPRSPRARTAIAAVIAVAATGTVLRAPQRDAVDIEPEQTFLRRRPMVAAILAPAPAAPGFVARAPQRDVVPPDEDPRPYRRPGIAAVLAPAPVLVLRAPQRDVVPPDEDPPLFRRPGIAAVIFSVDTVLCPPGGGAMSEEPEYLPRGRTGIAAVIAPVAGDVLLRAPQRDVVPPDDDPPLFRRPGIAAVLAAPVADFVPRAPQRDLLSPDDDPLPIRRPQIAAVLYAPDTLLRAPQRDVVPPDEDVFPFRRSKIAAVLYAPDTVLRPLARVAAQADDDTMPERRPGIAAVLAPPPPPDALRPARRSELATDEAPPVRPRPGIAAVLVQAPDQPFLRARTMLLEDDVLPVRRPGIAAVLYAPDTVLRPSRADVLWPDDDAPGRARTKIAAAISAPPAAPDFVPKPPARQILDVDQAPDRRPRPIAALLAAAPPPPDFVTRRPRVVVSVEEEWLAPFRRAQIAAVLPAVLAADLPRAQRLIVAAEDWFAPPRRPGIAAVLPVADFVPRNQRAVVVSDDWQAPIRRVGIAAVLAPAPAPDFIPHPNQRAILEELHELPRRRAPIAAVLEPPPPPADVVPTGTRARDYAIALLWDAERVLQQQQGSPQTSAPPPTPLPPIPTRRIRAGSIGLVDFVTGQGDTEPYVDVLREPDGTPADLSDALSVKYLTKRADGGSRFTSLPASFLSKLGGAVYVNPPTTRDGIYLAQWIVTFPDNVQRTFPRGDYRRIEVTPKIQ